MVIRNGLRSDSRPARPRARRLRHSGEALALDQRRRIHAGVAAAVSHYGYEHATVKRIIEPAGVSRRTFYELFAGREDAFLHAHEEALADLTARVSAATALRRSWAEKTASAISAALLLAVESPECGLLLAGGTPAAGPWAAHVHDQLLMRFAPGLSRGRQLSGEPKAPTLEEALLSGIAGVVAARLRAGRARELPGLAPALSELTLAPYLGIAAARAAGSAQGGELRRQISQF